ncbi:hypothetical protein AYO71_17750 [Pseudomonas koreensis]|nr:hypothetical protein AYO71_17750 [Pseudomonas koreensis]
MEVVIYALRRILQGQRGCPCTAHLRLATSTVAGLSAFATSLGCFFTIVGEVAARLSAFFPGLLHLVTIVAGVTCIFISGGHDSSPISINVSLVMSVFVMDTYFDYISVHGVLIFFN